MPEERAPVDVEALAIAHLETDDDLGALVGGPGDAARISSKLPPDFPSAGLALVQVFRVSATEVDPETGHLERAVVQTNAYGSSKGEAWDVYAQTHRALRAARRVDHALGVVTGVERVSGPTWSPDPRTSAPRYTAAYAVTVHPVPSG